MSEGGTGFRGQVGSLEIAIDPDLCVGFGDCVEADPVAFRLNEEGLAVLVDPASSSRSRLIEAARACPVDAITVTEIPGRVLAP